MNDEHSKQNLEEQTKVLQAFSRALAREAHVLQARPDLLWQQLYNRLQWDEGVKRVITPEYEQRSGQGVKPWIRTGTPYRESQTLVRTLTKHTENVTTCAISPDGRFLASSGEDSTIVLWDIHNRKEHATLTGHGGFIYCCAFSPDGHTLASAGYDRTVRLWDVSDGEAKAVLRGHTKPVISCAFSPDGQTLVSGGDDKTIRLWDILNGQEKKVHDNPNYLRCCVFSPDGNTLALACGDSWIRLWDVRKGKKRKVLRGHTNDVYSCAFSPDGLLLASAGQDNTVRLWNSHNGREIRILSGHTDRVRSCTFSPDGHLLASAGDDQTLRLWDVNTGQELAAFFGHTQSVNACCFSPDGRFLASASLDCKVRFWEVNGYEPQEELDGYGEGVKFCVLSPNGQTLASARRETIHLLNTRTGKKQEVNTGEINWVHACAFSPDGGILAIASLKHSVRLMHIHGSESVPLLEGHNEAVYDCAFAPDGRTMASASGDKTLRLWNIYSGAELDVLTGHNQSVKACTFSPDGCTLASGGYDHTIRMWDTHSGKELAILLGHTQSVDFCAFSPDGQVLASVSGLEGTLRLWDVRSAAEFAALTGHHKTVTTCAFSPDGRFLIYVGKDSTIKLWELETKAELVTMSLPLLGSINCIAFHPWLPQVMCIDEGGNLYILDLVGIIYAPIIVTPKNWWGKDLTVHCPACQQEILVTKSQLGRELNCAGPGCDQRFRINPFHLGLEVEIASKSDIKANIRQIAVATNGQLISGYEHGYIGISTPNLTKPNILLDTHSDSIVSVAVISSAHLAATASQDGILMVWDLKTHRLVEQMAYHREVTALAITPGWRIGVGLADGMIMAWETSCDPVQLSGHEDRITAVTFLSNGQIVSAGMDLKIRLWDPETLQMLESFSGLKSPIRMMSAVGVGKCVACGCEDGLMFIWDFEGRRTKSTYRTPSSMLGVASCRSSFLLGDPEGNVSVFDIENGKTSFQKKYNTPIIGGALSPDGCWGAVLDDRGGISRFKVEK